MYSHASTRVGRAPPGGSAGLFSRNDGELSWAVEHQKLMDVVPENPHISHECPVQSSAMASHYEKFQIAIWGGVQIMQGDTQMPCTHSPSGWPPSYYADGDSSRRSKALYRAWASFMTAMRTFAACMSGMMISYPPCVNHGAALYQTPFLGSPMSEK